MKLNLGCGGDVKQGYVNVDFRQLPGIDVVTNLIDDKFPFEDEVADEILMYDFFEHVPYAKAKWVLSEVWRVTKSGGCIEIQVPDFEHCARAALGLFPFHCNRCEREIVSFDAGLCSYADCKHPHSEMARAAFMRLYGGQDYPGNFHYFAFTRQSLMSCLTDAGFGQFEELEKEHQWKNWNFKMRARKNSGW